MKGDFSRQTFDARKHYAGVLMQQGRVQTDADWNEQEAIQRRRDRVHALDEIGACGAPEHAAGFLVTIAGKKMTLGAGRYYVQGILCENETQALAYEAQPDLPSPPEWTDVLAKAKASFGIVYLDVWERHVTSLDDPLLRESALGGPDTATRVKTVWQVRVLPLASATGDPARIEQLQARRALLQKKLDAMEDSGANPADVAKLAAEIGKIDDLIASLKSPPSCGGEFDEWDALDGDPARRLNARTQPPPPVKGPCVVPPTAGYRRLENQLYRVEVHRGGALGTATFKWSRDNGSVVTSVEKISGKDVTVHDLGPDEVLGFAPGQWVEISDDRSELAGKPGQLVQIDAVSSSLRRVTLKTAPAPLAGGADGVDPALHPKLRRWDQSGDSATADGVGTSADWLPLEDGVEVQFAAADYRTGDYWVIPARTATGEVEWPPFAVPNTAPVPQPRRGILHHFCRLALVGFDAKTETWGVLEDCRRVFAPLTEPCCGRSNALHVVETNWANDDLFTLGSVNKDGLRIRLDAAPDPASLTNDTVEVALEFPTGDTQNAPATVFQRTYVRGVVGLDPADDTVIVWRTQSTAAPPHVVVGPHVVGPAGARAPKFTLVELPGARVRVTLKGAVIWSEPRGETAKVVHLDGRCRGRPGLRADGKTPRIDLAFPSGGGGGGASDFESWFALGVPAKPSALQVTNVRFLNPNNQPSSAGDVKPPLQAGQRVVFKAGEQVRSVEVTFSRAVDPKSLGSGALQSVFVEFLGGPAPKRLVADLVPAGAVVRIVLKDPPVIAPGNYQLVCIGTAIPTAAAMLPAVAAADDQSALDGDYDNTPGGNFALPFTAV